MLSWRNLFLIMGCIIPTRIAFSSVNVSPDVMLILDSSGSMTLDMNGYYTWGDGSEDYPGKDTDSNGVADDSRLYILKKAIYNVVADYPDVQFGLMTYGQYRNITEPSRGGPGGGGLYRISPYMAANTQNIPWHGINDSAESYWPKDYPDSLHEVLRVQIDSSSADHITELQNWVDNKDADRNTEIRADGGTPIGGVLYWAKEYYRQEIIPGDSTKCRKYFVILVSDGEETGYPSNNPHSPYVETTNLRHTLVNSNEYDIKTYVVGMGVSGGSAELCLDSTAKNGGTYHYYPCTTSAEVETTFKYILANILADTIGIQESSTLKPSNSQTLKLQVFPNPFTTATTIQLSSASGGLNSQLSTLSIFDLSGKLVETTNKMIIGKNLKAGVYFVKLGNSKPIKLIKLGELK